jgi:putative membrane protein
MIGGGFGMGDPWIWLWGGLLLVGVALLAILAVRGLAGGIDHRRRTLAGVGDAVLGDRRGPGRSRAREILDERFAQGELTSEEYRERLRILGEDT